MVVLSPRQGHRRTPSWAISVLLSLSLVAAGCTTMKPLDMSSDELRAAIRAGEFGQPGQQMMAVTADGERHAFAFQGVDTTQDVVRAEGSAGEAVAVPIGDIVAVRVPSTDGRPTALLVVGALFAVAVAVYANAVEDFFDIFSL